MARKNEIKTGVYRGNPYWTLWYEVVGAPLFSRWGDIPKEERGSWWSRYADSTWVIKVLSFTLAYDDEGNARLGPNSAEWTTLSSLKSYEGTTSEFLAEQTSLKKENLQRQRERQEHAEVMFALANQIRDRVGGEVVSGMYITIDREAATRLVQLLDLTKTP